MLTLFSSRSFWVALLTLLVVVLVAFLPGFQLDVEHTAGLAVIAAGYIVAYALNPSGSGLRGMLTSRKFWAALLGFLFVFLDAFHIFPARLDVAELASLVALICAYVIVLAVDPGSGWRGLLVSRKFWAALIGVTVIFLNAFKISLPAGLTSDQVVSIVVILGGYIAGAGIQGKPAELPEPTLADDDGSSTPTVS